MHSLPEPAGPLPNPQHPTAPPDTQQTLFGDLLRDARGEESRLSFSKRLQLSYTFVRAMEAGTRFPSDEVLQTIANRLHINAEELLLAAHCDRSPALTRALEHRGLYVSRLRGQRGEQTHHSRGA